MENHLHEKLKEIRIKAKKSVPEVSQYLTALGHKASAKTVYSWEAGRSRPTIDIFLDMCQYYGILDIISYFGNDDHKQDANSEKTKNFPTSTAEVAPGEEEHLLKLYHELNEEGQEKLIDYADDLAKSGKYIKNDTCCMGSKATKGA